MADQNQLPPWLAATRPDIVVMHLGTNDVWRQLVARRLPDRRDRPGRFDRDIEFGRALDARRRPGITQLWNGALTVSGTGVAVRNLSYNGSLPANGTTVFGFAANGSPNTPTLTCGLT